MFQGKKIVISEGRNYIPFYRQLYSAIESGYPCIIAFINPKGGVGHILTVIGHTFQPNTLIPWAEESYFRPPDKIDVNMDIDNKYLSSSKWTHSIICHDDMYGPHYHFTGNLYK